MTNIQEQCEDYKHIWKETNPKFLIRRDAKDRNKYVLMKRTFCEEVYEYTYELIADVTDEVNYTIGNQLRIILNQIENRDGCSAQTN